ncbi:MAG: TraB/GumN family protein [Candidatus Woesearchaeota archaeon]
MELKIIGTSHVSKESAKEIESTILSFKPDIVAIELDIQRYHALISKKRDKIGFSDIKKIGFKGFLFALIGEYVERKIGEQLKIKPGVDMLTAIKVAKKFKLTIALIDQPLAITLQRFSKSISWKEKWNFFVDLVKGVFLGKKQLKEMGLTDIDLSKVPPKENIKKLLMLVKKRYPNFYKVLVEERNAYMAKQLNSIIQKNPDKRIIAVVGAGHEEGISKLIGRN